MERESALKNIFHCNHLLIKDFYSPMLRLISDPMVRGCMAVPAAALLPPGAGACCASNGIWAELILIFLQLSSQCSLGSCSRTSTTSAGQGIPYGAQLFFLGGCGGMLPGCPPHPTGCGAGASLTISITVTGARGKASVFSLSFSSSSLTCANAGVQQ